MSVSLAVGGIGVPVAPLGFRLKPIPLGAMGESTAMGVEVMIAAWNVTFQPLRTLWCRQYHSLFINRTLR